VIKNYLNVCVPIIIIGHVYINFYLWYRQHEVKIKIRGFCCFCHVMLCLSKNEF
jgi:hypothetical protein